jgi:hypothetical protein
MGLAHIIHLSFYFVPKVPLGRGCLYIAPPLPLETLDLIWYLTWIEHELLLSSLLGRPTTSITFELFKASYVIEPFLDLGFLLGFGLLLCNYTNFGLFPIQNSTPSHSYLSSGILAAKILLHRWNGPMRATISIVYLHVGSSCSSPRWVELWDRAKIQGLILIIWYQQSQVATDSTSPHPILFPKIFFHKFWKYQNICLRSISRIGAFSMVLIHWFDATCIDLTLFAFPSFNFANFQ